MNFLLKICVFPLLALLTITVGDAGADLQEMLSKNSLAVMPCLLGKATPNTPANQKEIIDCTLEELCYLEGDPLKDAAQIITELLQREMLQRFGTGVLPLDRVRDKYQDLTLRDFGQGLKLLTPELKYRQNCE